MTATETHKQLFFLLLYLVAIGALVTLFFDYVTFILLGAIIVMALHPVNRRLEAYVGNKVSAALMTTLVLVAILLPVYLSILGIVDEVSTVRTFITETNLTAVETMIQSVLGVSVSIEEVVETSRSSLQSYVGTQIPSLLGSVTSGAINIFISLFVVYYGFKDGTTLSRNFINVLPLSDSYKKRLEERGKNVLYGVLYGQLLISFIQGILGGISFWVLGIQGPFFWGFVMTVLSFIPVLGTPLIWGPAGIYLLFSGQVTAGVILLVFNSVVTMNIDNLLKPMIIGEKTQMHPLLVILSIFGGINLFGFIGFVLGPVLVALATLIIQFYLEDFSHSSSQSVQ